MIRFGALFWLAVAGISASVLFQVKHEVQGLVDELSATEAAIVRDREAIRVLKAEWSYLDRPARIAELASRHLGLVPLAPKQIASYGVLPPRPEDFGYLRQAGLEGPPLPPRRPEDLPGLAEVRLAGAGKPAVTTPAAAKAAAKTPVGKTPLAKAPLAKASAARTAAAKAPAPAQPAAQVARSGPRLNPVTGRPLPAASVSFLRQKDGN